MLLKRGAAIIPDIVLLPEVTSVSTPCTSSRRRLVASMQARPAEHEQVLTEALGADPEKQEKSDNGWPTCESAPRKPTTGLSSC